PARATLVPYTTLFRSADRAEPHPEGFALLPHKGRPAEPPHFRIYSISDAAGRGHRRSELVADLTLSDASPGERAPAGLATASGVDRKSTRLNSSHDQI